MNGYNLPDWMVEALKTQGAEEIELVNVLGSEYGIPQPVLKAEIGGSEYYAVWFDGIARDGSELEWHDTQADAEYQAF